MPLPTELHAREHSASTSVPSGVTTTVLGPVPVPLGTREVAVFVESDQNGNLTIRRYARNRAITVDQVVAVVAATPQGVVATAPAGQECELLFAQATASTATVEVWVALRS